MRLCLAWAIFFLYLAAGQQDVAVRLANGTTEREGRVEIRYNGTWGTICDDDWDVSDAAVVCKMLGFTSQARSYGNAEYGQGTGPVWLDSVQCDGSESSLVDCPSQGWGNSNCKHDEDAGVICLGQKVAPTASTTTTVKTTTTTLPPKICNNASAAVRLLDGPNAAAGRVEVFRAGRWGSICDDQWGQQDAAVICRMLCYNPSNARAHLGEEYGNATSRYWMDDVRCTGKEYDIADCPFSGWDVSDCDITEAAGVSCMRDTPGLPEVPKPVIDCNQEEITAKFDRAIEPRLQPRHLSVADEKNDCGFSTSQDGSYTSISIPFTKCSTKRETNDTHIIYRNRVRHALPAENPVISRTTVYVIDVYCAMDRDNKEDKNYEPEPQTVPPRFGDGQFNINMFLYKNNRFDEPITSFPARLKLGEWLYVGVKLQSTDMGLKLVVPDCKATATAAKASKPDYNFIKQKCKVESSVTYYPFNETIFAFRFQTFRFFGNFSYVYLHCDAFVCEINEKTAQCDRSCSTRAKRSVSLPLHEYHVEEGPIMLLGSDGNEAPNRPDNRVVGDVQNGALRPRITGAVVLWIIRLVWIYLTAVHL